MRPSLPNKLICFGVSDSVTFERFSNVHFERQPPTTAEGDNSICAIVFDASLLEEVITQQTKWPLGLFFMVGQPRTFDAISKALKQIPLAGTSDELTDEFRELMYQRMKERLILIKKQEGLDNG